MIIGKLRQRISIQEPQETQDATGALTTTWRELATTWASVEPATGSERWVQNMDQRIAQRAARVRLRYRDDVVITEKCRIMWQQHTYGILSMADVAGAKRDLLLMCEEINPDVA